MNQCALITAIESGQLKTDVPSFCIGDTIKVHIRITEGEKERIQVFTGTVIARRGSGLSETFSVYRVAYGSSMERVFMLHSPRIARIEITRRGKVRRAKLYYLRGMSGKKAKIKEKMGTKKKIITDSQVLRGKKGGAAGEGSTSHVDQSKEDHSVEKFKE